MSIESSQFLRMDLKLKRGYISWKLTLASSTLSKRAENWVATLFWVSTTLARTLMRWACNGIFIIIYYVNSIPIQSIQFFNESRALRRECWWAYNSNYLSSTGIGQHTFVVAHDSSWIIEDEIQEEKTRKWRITQWRDDHTVMKLSKIFACIEETREWEELVDRVCVGYGTAHCWSRTDAIGRWRYIILHFRDVLQEMNEANKMQLFGIKFICCFFQLC